MAKRFTDNEKWKRPWFRALSVKQKLIWLYLCDDCDCAGIWLGDFELMGFQLGFKVAENDLMTMGDKIEKYGDKYLITNFFDFQYGHQKDTFSAKIAASNRIKWLKDRQWGDCPPTVPPDSMESTSISIGISRSIGIEGGMGETSTPTPSAWANQIYALYPRKVGKKRGIEKLSRVLKTDRDFQNVLSGVQNYVAYLQTNETDSRHIKHFDTFVNSWEDWLEPDAGSGLDFSGPKTQKTHLHRLNPEDLK